MFPKSPRWLLLGVCLLALSGCLYPVRDEVDHTVCGLARQPIDLEPPPVAAPSLSPPSAPTTPAGTEKANPSDESAGPSARILLPLSAQVPEAPVVIPGEPKKPRPEPLRIPPDLPGANAPVVNFSDDPKERQRQIDQEFPPLPELGPDPQPVGGPGGHPLTLAELQRLAMSNSPLIRQAAADVTAAEGAARQAGAYPNPTTGPEADTAGTGGLPGYQGWFFDQTIRTAGKLKLSEAMGLMDLENSRIALRRAQTDLEAQVRSGYFAVLVAEENMRVSRALVDVTDQMYRLLLLQFRTGGIAAYYEPTLLRVYAFQARGALVQARNSYLAAWKQLAATLGLSGMPLTELAGRADMPVPSFDWDQALARVLAAHTDVRTARVTEQRARYNLRLQQVTPVPDFNVHLALQKDYTTPTRTLVTTAQVGLPVPLWDQNKGGIIQAQGQLVRAVEESHRIRDDLTGRLADAYQRYRTNLTLLEYYRAHVLPDQVRFYRGVRERWRVDLGVQFADIVNAQQTLGAAIATYVTTLTALWTAVSDMASLLQTDDLFQAAPPHCLPSAPDFVALLQLPCSHRCSPLQDPALKGAAAGWPAYSPGEQPAPAARPAPPTVQPDTPVPLPMPSKEPSGAMPLQFEANPQGPGLEATAPGFTVPVPGPREAAPASPAANPVREGKVPAYLPALPTPCPLPAGDRGKGG
jgi:cobalt-zinc-cadmium efflux system outer membrane protein